MLALRSSGDAAFVIVLIVSASSSGCASFPCKLSESEHMRPMASIDTWRTCGATSAASPTICGARTSMPSSEASTFSAPSTSYDAFGIPAPVLVCSFGATSLASSVANSIRAAW